MIAGPQAAITRELTRYPDVDELAEIVEADQDAVTIDVDPDPERALDVVENVCETSAGITVMVYPDRTDHELLVRCMRAGAREFLTEPLSPEQSQRHWFEPPRAATKDAVREEGDR